MKTHIKIIILSVVLCQSMSGRDVDESAGLKPETGGNFALPVSQEPAPLISFGQNIMDKGDLLLYSYIDYTSGITQSYTVWYPSLLYAIKDNFSFLLEVPVALKFKSGDDVSHALCDVVLQFEYAFYAHNSDVSTATLSTVFNVSLPTGSTFKIPATGLGVPGVFLGFTGSRVTAEWYYFASLGAVAALPYNNIRYGNEFLYQCGISRNINYAQDRWIFNWMIELGGTYASRDKVGGCVDPNSGGNQLLLCPSLWFSGQKVLVQVGLGWYLGQHLYGCQEKSKMYAAFDIGYKF